MAATHLLFREADPQDCDCGHCEGKFNFSITFESGAKLHHRDETLEGVLLKMAQELTDWGGFYNLNELRSMSCN